MRTEPDRLGSIYQLRTTDTRTLLALGSLTRKKKFPGILGAVAHAYNPSTQEGRVRGQTRLHSESCPAIPHLLTPQRKRKTKEMPQYYTSGTETRGSLWAKASWATLRPFQKKKKKDHVRNSRGKTWSKWVVWIAERHSTHGTKSIYVQNPTMRKGQTKPV